MPVASLWASPDYKSVANCPILVSRILLLMSLISEIKLNLSSRKILFIVELSQGLKGFLTTKYTFSVLKVAKLN